IHGDASHLALHCQSVDASVALAARGDELGFADAAPAILGATRPEDLLEDELKLLDNHRVIPVAHLPQALWLNGTVHNWQQQANGAWQLDQLWIEGAR